MAGNGNGVRQVELQFERVEVLDLLLAEERKTRLQIQMQLVQQQAQQLQREMEMLERDRNGKVAALSAKYGVNVERFAINTDTNIATGSVPD